MITIKSQREIDLLREAGRIVALTHQELQKHIKPGISTLELDEIAEKTIRSYGATPSFKGYGGFPGTICASVNEVVVHGIPKKNIKEFCGKPILVYSIEAALQSKLFDEVMVSTDDNEIAQIAKEYGADDSFKFINAILDSIKKSCRTA